MGLRTLEISKPAEVHVKRGQLEITNEDGSVQIPLDDLMTITCIGSNIRMSTMAQAQMAGKGIFLLSESGIKSKSGGSTEQLP